MSSFNWDRYNEMPVIGIVRNLPAQRILEMAGLYYECGFSTIEVTMNTPGATALISQLVQQFGTKLNIGAGTVCTEEDLDAAISAGASFIVTPVLNEDIIRSSVEQTVPIFPGAYTPTEIFNAWTYGASMVKVFPATKLGPGYIKDVLAPMSYLKLVPTGGVDLNNITDFFSAGAAGVGLGSNLFPKQIVEQGRWDELKTILESFRNKISDYRTLQTN